MSRSGSMRKFVKMPDLGGQVFIAFRLRETEASLRFASRARSAVLLGNEFNHDPCHGTPVARDPPETSNSLATMGTSASRSEAIVSDSHVLAMAGSSEYNVQDAITYV